MNPEILEQIESHVKAAQKINADNVYMLRQNVDLDTSVLIECDIELAKARKLIAENK